MFLSEPESIATERKTLLQTQSVLQKSVRAIKKDPDLSKNIDTSEEKPEKKPVERPREERAPTREVAREPVKNTQPAPAQQRSMTPSSNQQPRPDPTKDQMFPPPRNDGKPQQQAPAPEQKKASGWKIFN